MSYHLSFFIYFTPLYISLIYGVFLNKVLHAFDDYIFFLRYMDDLSFFYFKLQ
jgi:hypothetical protein